MTTEEALARITAHIDELTLKHLSELRLMAALAKVSIVRSAGQHRRRLKTRKP